MVLQKGRRNILAAHSPGVKTPVNVDHHHSCSDQVLGLKNGTMDRAIMGQRIAIVDQRTATEVGSIMDPTMEMDLHLVTSLAIMAVSMMKGITTGEDPAMSITDHRGTGLQVKDLQILRNVLRDHGASLGGLGQELGNLTRSLK